MKAWIVALALGTLCCMGPDEASIRHLVLAELITKYQVSEDMVQILDMRSPATGREVVTARVDSSGRAGVRRTVRCTLRQEGRRWILERVEEE